MPDNRDQLDRLLDSALATYADPGPDSDFEGRILSRMANERIPAPRRRWLKWAVALPVAAALVLFLSLSGVWRVQMTPSSPQARNLRQPSASTPGEVAEKERAESGMSRQRPAVAKARHTLDGANGPTEVVPCYKPLPSSCETTSSQPQRPAPMRRSDALLRKPNLHRVELAARSAPLPKLEIYPTPQPLSSQEEALVNFAAHAPQSERESLLSGQEQSDAPLRIAAIEIQPLEPPASGAN